MMNKLKDMCFSIVIVLIIALSVDCGAQGFDLFGGFGLKNKRKRNKNMTTRINSDSLDIQYKKNVITFVGNVVLDDQDVKIECDKMIIKLADDSKEKVGKKPKTIECIGNFVATRKPQNEEEKKEGTQRAVAGKAILDMDSGSIVMLKNPMLIRGTEALKGTKITIWLRSEKLVAENAEVKTVGGDILGEVNGN